LFVFSSLSTLNISLYFLLVCMVSEEKLDVILIFEPLLERCFFPLWFLSGFFLFFDFLSSRILLVPHDLNLNLQLIVLSLLEFLPSWF